ncbi:MAG: hypothetical protein PUE17_02870 [Bacteroidales bacterium]|nr:hypothetical protein [Bacteroidales bacterium]
MRSLKIIKSFHRQPHPGGYKVPFSSSSRQISRSACGPVFFTVSRLFRRAAITCALYRAAACPEHFSPLPALYQSQREGYINVLALRKWQSRSVGRDVPPG